MSDSWEFWTDAAALRYQVLNVSESDFEYLGVLTGAFHSQDNDIDHHRPTRASLMGNGGALFKYKGPGSAYVRCWIPLLGAYRLEDNDCRVTQVKLNLVRWGPTSIVTQPRLMLDDRSKGFKTEDIDSFYTTQRSWGESDPERAIRMARVFKLAKAFAWNPMSGCLTFVIELHSRDDEIVIEGAGIRYLE